MSEKTIARHLFFSCEKSCFGTMEFNSYIILNDGYYVRDFVARNDEEACAYFKGYIDGMEYERKRRNR